MAVVIETTAGDLTVDLFVDERPRACQNFLKLCRLKYYNYNLFHTIQRGFIAQTGDPSGVGTGGSSVWGVLEGDTKRYFKADSQPKIRHSDPGLLSMVSLGDGMVGSQFFFTLGSDLTSLDGGAHCVIGQVVEGVEVLRTLNDTICDAAHRPYQDVRIAHTVVLDDPFGDPRGLRAPSRSPSPSAERLRGGRIGADEDIDDTDGKTEQEVAEMMQEREARARATILEIVGDLPDADMAPPENVLFVCKLNPVTSDDDLEIIFSRFGRVKGCEVIRDRVTGDSLQYAFVEFEDSKTCESAYFKMDNVLIDDRRIHVDFSQSVAKVQWRGKGRGLILRDGQKGDRLNFGDLKQTNNGGGKQRQQDQQGQQRHQNQQRKGGEHRQPDQPRNGGGRPDVRRSSPARGQARDQPRGGRSPNRMASRELPDRRRDGEQRRDRENRAERPRSRERRRSRSRDRQRTRSRERRRSRSIDRVQRSVTDRTATKQPPAPSARNRSRSPARRTRNSPSPDGRAANRRERSGSRSFRRDVQKAAAKQRERSASANSSVDSETDSDDSSDRRKASKRSKSKKSKKPKKKSKKSRKHASSTSDSSSEDSSDDGSRHKKKKKRSTKHRK